jgi:polysaccharide biosynthesis protein PslG
VSSCLRVFVFKKNHHLVSFLCLVLTACLGVASPVAEPTPPPPTATPIPLPALPPGAGQPSSADPHIDSPEYGLQIFSWWNFENGLRDLDVINGMGFGWVKQIFAWRDIEQIEKGHYDWFRPDLIVGMIEEKNLNLLVRIDHQPFWTQADGGAVPLPSAPPANYADFGDFCGVFAARYKGRIRAYEIWNEPNLAREWGNQLPDPAGYVQLLAHCYVAIKTADPEAIVISAGLAPTATDDENAMPDDAFVRGMYAAGGAKYFDVLGVHAAGYMNPPERSPDDVEADPALGYRFLSFRRVEDIREIMVQYGDGEKQIAITEMGWTTDPLNPTYAWYAVSEEQQAAFLVRAYQWAKTNWTPWMGLMTTIYMADPDWTEQNEQYWFAINRPSFPDFDPRPSYYALRDMEK